MIRDYLSMAWTNVTHRKVRSYLTMIGIFIGIAAVVSLVALGQGLNTAIAEQLSAIGGDKLFISAKAAIPGEVGTASSKLTDKDMEVVEHVRGIARVAPYYYKTGIIEYRKGQIFYYIVGMPEENDQVDLVYESFKIKVIEGRYLRQGENSKVMIASDYLLKDIFPRRVHAGSRITINGQEFEVVGVVETSDKESGSDKQVFMTRQAWRDLFGTGDEVQMMMAQVAKGEDIAQVSSGIERALRRHRGLDVGEEDFTVQTPLQLVEAFAAIFNIVQTVLIGIAGISLIVGAVGIMNTMYTAVVERTKEIGIMKAIGATNRQVFLIFLVESGLLGLAGGMIGVLLGIGIGKLVQAGAEIALGGSLIRAEFPPSLIIGALVFSFVVGALSGALPALQASKLKPVDAIRSK